MELLAEYSVDAIPGRRFIEIYDADAYLADAASMDAARQQVVAGNGYHLYLHSLQPDIPARIDIRIWDTPPSVPTDAEGHTGVTVESETGTLVVNQFTYGPAGEMILPRPGVYEGHAWWAGRQAVRDYHDRVLRDLTASGQGTRLPDDWRRSPHTERYVLDLAWIRDSSPLDNEDEDEPAHRPPASPMHSASPGATTPGLIPCLRPPCPPAGTPPPPSAVGPRAFWDLRSSGA
ncbi:hypothetical protein GCM10010294_58680 [Streptomyces griseoloalbus]|uniref:hypothetical protein n=1 Tax=Streptomyces griseoloalbus TaxID=67303 RepID=UPI0018752231|nr:hypothetical protein GCM10010294_58680 [Streptomyces griseoloalbus]